MKNLFLTLGAVLTFGMASAQINGQNTAGQITKTGQADASRQDMAFKKSAIDQPQNATTANGIATPGTAPASAGMSTTGSTAGTTANGTSAGTSISGAGGGSTVTTGSVSNTTNTTNATTTGKPKKQ